MLTLHNKHNTITFVSIRQRFFIYIIHVYANTIHIWIRFVASNNGTWHWDHFYLINSILNYDKLYMIHYFTFIITHGNLATLQWRPILFWSFMEQFYAVKILHVHTVVQSYVHIHSTSLTSYNQYRSPGSCTPSPVCLSARSSVAGPSPDGRSGSSALVPPAGHDEGRREMGLWGAGSSFNKRPIPNSSQNNSKYCDIKFV